MAKSANKHQSTASGPVGGFVLDSKETVREIKRILGKTGRNFTVRKLAELRRAGRGPEMRKFLGRYYSSDPAIASWIAEEFSAPTQSSRELRADTERRRHQAET